VKIFLARSAKEWRAWLQQFPLSHRRRSVGWIDSARREKTRARRLAEAIRMLTAGNPLGMK
jgi:hypothetical protein